MRKIDSLQYQIQQVLPTVYDDSLSFYELVNKVVQKLNEVIAQSNEYFSQGLETVVGDILTEWYQNGQLETIINDTIFSNLDQKIDQHTGISVIQYGAKGDGVTDDTVAIQRVIDENRGKTIIIPRYFTFSVRQLTIPSGTRLQVEGTLKHHPNSTGAMLLNENRVSGDSAITIIGQGTLDGNKDETNRTHLVDMLKVDRLHIEGITVKNNNFDNTLVEVSATTGSLYLQDCTFFTIQNVFIQNYAREGLWVKGGFDGVISNVTAVGGVDSWSGLQVSGSRHHVTNCKSFKAGASGIGIDASYSLVENCLVQDNTYFNGFNVGHEQGVTRHTHFVNCTALNSGYLTSDPSQVANGFNIVAGSEDIRLTNCVSDGSQKDGFNVSAGATRVTLVNCQSTRCKRYGVNQYGGELHFIGCDFRGNDLQPFKRGLVAGETHENTDTKFTDDVVYGSVNIAGLGAGGSTTVSNGNVTNRSRIILQASNQAGLDAQPFISALNDGNFVITTKNSGVGGAHARYFII